MTQATAHKGYFRLWQFSDPHLFADTTKEFYGINCHESFQQVLRLALSHSIRADLSIFTGDLVHDGSEAAYRRLVKLIEATGVKAGCLAGNHDEPGLMAQIMVTAQVSCRGHMLHQGWLIILVNTFWPGHEAGMITEHELESIEGLINKHPEKHVMLAMHHPPVQTSMVWMDTAVTLINPELIKTLVQQYPVIKAVCWGHAHQAYETLSAGVLWAGCPSTMAQFKPGQEDFALDHIAAGFRVFDLYRDGSINSNVYRLDSNTSSN